MSPEIFFMFVVDQKFWYCSIVRPWIWNNAFDLSFSSDISRCYVTAAEAFAVGTMSSADSAAEQFIGRGVVLDVNYA